MKKIVPIILSGGIGSRLWPLSTKNLPKQFLNLPFGSKQNLFQQTLKGFKNRKVFDKPIVICGDEHKFLLFDSVKSKNEVGNIIVEKIQKNTAASVLLGSLYAMKNGAEYVMVVPSDHYLKRRDYSKIIPKEYMNFPSHTIFGIKPNEPNVDYGYIKVKEPNRQTSIVEKFFEKPNKINAMAYVKKNYFWNSGMFLINIEVLKNNYQKFHPNMFKICKEIINNLKFDLDFLVAPYKLMKPLEKISFDTAILEKVSDIYMTKLKVEWDDLGTWSSLRKYSNKDEIKLDKKITVHNDSDNTFVISDKRNTIVNDLSNAIVVSYKDSLFASSIKKANDIKHILSQKKYSKVNNFQSLFFKPWGFYEVFSSTENYLLKKISIKPKCRLSLQKHKYRSEHWVVVKGKAKVIKGKEIKVLKENQSTFIPKGLKHCIENIGKGYLEIVEVQIGSILSEDDIIRFDDPYKR
ncbi:MAG: mannose-1-phosphate guanylyltransferase/mannose-6-phosphate isomerase [Rickettsiales bacterium]|nr:mannose-1-phosphate guanylyltransferase/mannose-6-phosphate isomerase [Rickettsiales bacterium]